MEEAEAEGGAAEGGACGSAADTVVAAGAGGTGRLHHHGAQGIADDVEAVWDQVGTRMEG